MMLTDFLMDIVFEQSLADPRLMRKLDKSEVLEILLVTYVDDTLTASNGMDAMNWFKQRIAQKNSIEGPGSDKLLHGMQHLATKSNAINDRFLESQ